ncbi:hypothetical protein [Asticcacaulis sp. AND118]|uniref:hypothetical protein n=1 Tax=Asticcacaulis sp. AND118 TaxID=2840468 RepID=UPI001CFFEF1A|nr:hypothetical protein [Asticcacaulis sp. AND118]UDF04542.1 hypothetical protein LH365_05760 [Asticcacaulis sp. AND118]
MNTFISNGPLTDWNDHDAFWNRDFSNRPYGANETYGRFQPAYRFGYDLYGENAGAAFNDLNDDDLRSRWESYPDRGDLPWDRARDAARDAYARRDIDTAPRLEEVIDKH